MTPLSHPLSQDPPQLGRDPRPTKHIVSAIMLNPPLWTLKPGIYRAWGTVEQGEPPSLYPSWPHSHTLYHKTTHSWVATPGPPSISCWRLCSFTLFLTLNLGHVGRGARLSRWNQPPFSVPPFFYRCLLWHCHLWLKTYHFPVPLRLIPRPEKIVTASVYVVSHPPILPTSLLISRQKNLRQSWRNFVPGKGSAVQKFSCKKRLFSKSQPTQDVCR